VNQRIFCWLLVLATMSNLACQTTVAQEGTAVADKASTAKEVRGPLADYVAKEDPSYGWKKIREGKIGSTEYAELILTSQTWRNIVWKHRLFILKPSTAKQTKQGFLVIAGGRWRDAYEDPDRDEEIPSESRFLALLAEKLQSPVAVLLNVPQQPIFGGMVEDEIISFTFEKYITTQDPEWPLLLPMVKSAVRGMDAVEEFCEQQWSLDLESFTVTGASKRGWTTWLLGAIDSRANAIAPMVIDTLNMGPQMKHQLEAWGDYSEEIIDYTRRDIPSQLNTPGGRALQKIIDPFVYRKSLLQPKLIIIGTNDHYWPIDALNLYWKELLGPKYILYVPNNRHGLRDYGRVAGSLMALHEEARGGTKMPQLSWSFADETAGGVTLRVESDQAPKKVQVWLADSPTRDFRKSTWRPAPTRTEDGAFVYDLKRPDSGHVALFGEIIYDRNGSSLFLSTNVRLLHSAKAANAAGEQEKK